MSRTPSRSPSTSPAKNTPEHYESAAREIEQEKQMVAALKRLSIGHLMNLDPDIPASDASFSFLMDRELSHEPEHYTESSLVPGSFSNHRDALESRESLKSHDSSELKDSIDRGNLPDFKNASNHGDSLDSHYGRQGDLSDPVFSGSPASKSSSKDSSRQSSPEVTQPSSVGEEISSEELLWVPANMHPEVNPQQFKSHVKTTIDELLERKLSRSKSANRSKRSSLSFSTTDEFPSGQGQNEFKADPGSKEQLSGPSDAAEIKNRNRLSNPSLRKLTSELQTMSRLAGMDSNDAVTLARSLSTSSLGYSEVERSAIDDMEQAGGFPGSSSHAEIMDVGVDETGQPQAKGVSYQNGYYTQNGYYHQKGQPRQNGPQPHQIVYPRSPRLQNYPGSPGGRPSPPGSPTPHSLVRNGSLGSNQNLPQGSNQNQVPRPNEDFSLRRSRRVDYRKGPASSSSGSQLQHNKAGKLAQLRHNISSSNLQAGTADVRPDRLSVQRPESNQRGSIASINPRSSQVLFTYKVPSQQSPSGHSRSSSPKAVAHPPTAAPLGGLSSKDSPYSSAMSSDTLGRNLQPTKYTQHNLTSRSLGHQNTPQVHAKTETGGSFRGGHRSTSRELEQQANHYYGPGTSQKKHPEVRSMSGSRMIQASHVGHRQISPTSQSLPKLDKRIASPGSQVQKNWPDNQRLGSDHQGMKRYGSQDGLSSGIASQEQKTRIPGSDKSDLESSRAFNKRDKTRQLNQNLDLLRNEINEFKESLATKSDPRTSGEEESNSASEQSVDAQQDFSFDLTHHDVSYEDTLGIEEDVLSELASAEDKSEPQANAGGTQNVATFDKSNDNEFVSIPDGAETKRSSFRDAVAHKDSHTRKLSQDHHKEDYRSDGADKELSQRKASLESMHHEKADAASSIPANASSKTYESEKSAIAAKKQEEAPVADVLQHAVSSKSKSTGIHAQDSSIAATSASTNEITRHDTTNSWESFERKNKKSYLDKSSASSKVDEKRKAKKNWPWSKEKSAGTRVTLTEIPSSKETRTPVRSVSSPEITASKKASHSAKEDHSGKDNAITKFFKKRRSSSVSHEKSTVDSHSAQNSVDCGEKEAGGHGNSKSSKKRHSGGSEKSQLGDASAHESGRKVLRRKTSADQMKNGDEQKVSSRIKNRIKNMKKINEDKEASPKRVSVIKDDPPAEDNGKPKSTLEVQEKLKKSIKRYSRPNQPIEFTDSAFGFPLPPPSSSTLVMIDYRFPVHVERAIYRLSHLKLANPKRSLREQVILSNFMYAYLNLVDHTLHLEQQMSSEDYEVEQPEGDLDFLGDQDVDTEFEADDGFEESDFDSIKIDLDVKEAQIST